MALLNILSVVAFFLSNTLTVHGTRSTKRLQTADGEDGVVAEHLNSTQARQAYEPPETATGGVQSMTSLMDPSWYVSDPTMGYASGKTNLAYAYGPAFAGLGQIMVWQYDHKNVLMYFAKDSCLGATDNGCYNHKGNHAGMMTCKACPSCSRSWSGSCNWGGGKQFNIGDSVDLSGYGKFVLENADGAGMIRLRPESSTSKCYLDHIYATSSRNGEPHYKTADGSNCTP